MVIKTELLRTLQEHAYLTWIQKPPPPSPRQLPLRYQLAPVEVMRSWKNALAAASRQLASRRSCIPLHH
uniref:Uncharacterized protein n=1 Tax=Oryza punctata TaxID=4537 RepID=A0A0E0MCX1_ORYPU